MYADPLSRGCFVRMKQFRVDQAFQVESCSLESGRWRVKLRASDGDIFWCDLEQLHTALKPGMRVAHCPMPLQPSLGSGVVQSMRLIGGREQALVLWDESGRSSYIPHERLARVGEPGDLFVRAEPTAGDDAERLVLRLLGFALENWNALTGALDRLDVDPLPHQIQLVHKIVSSGSLNWLIADDVGLGKTIETGLLLAALKRSDRARRVLIVSPAGLTLQWKQEMEHKFDQSFRIYGRDVQIHEVSDWDHYDHLIVSLDLAKRPEHLERFRQSGRWDIVVFDEGHKLSRRSLVGERTERYVFAQTLRAQSNGFIVLTATPHQGQTERFAALLELVRPDLRPQLQAIEANPEVVKDIILRNRKSLVTDQNGAFIFRGHTSHRVAVALTPAVREFQAALTRYLQSGYRAGDEAGGAAGRAIGFVMTTFRKLASSSVAAIETALGRRLERLYKETAPIAENAASIEDWDEDEEEADEDLASADEISARGEFFEYEAEQLNTLLLMCQRLRSEDPKLQRFLQEVVEPVVKGNEKLLIFTEYRATQLYLKQMIEAVFPGRGVAMINGSMSLEEKLSNIDRFDTDDNFLISTEAGGEGLNLHRACHVMVNYDLPWNPTRLVQRIGRLYRYGQGKRVIVFNLHTQDSFDNKALSMMVERITALVRDLAPVGDEFNESVEAELLGELLDRVDMGDVLHRSRGEADRSAEDVDLAIDRARVAMDLQREIFSHAEGYDPSAVQGLARLGSAHVQRFVRGMCAQLGIKIEEGTKDGEVVVLRLPEAHVGRYREFGNRSRVPVTCIRGKSRARDVVVLDAATDFFQALIKAAKGPDFSSGYAAIASESAEGVLGAFLLRWQDGVGEPLTDELVTVFLNARGETRINPDFLTDLLLTSAAAGQPLPLSEKHRRDARDVLRRAADRALAAGSGEDKHPNARLAVTLAEYAGSS